MTDRGNAALTRREWITRASGALALLLGARALRADVLRGESPTRITVYKDPQCRCCADWVTHLRSAGFAPVAQDRTDMDALKDGLGVPRALRSCHTAVVGRYLIEGHVPAPDIARLLAAMPRGTVGLAVPGMPVGSPGMEVGNRRDAYEVLAFDAAGRTRVFAHHGA